MRIPLISKDAGIQAFVPDNLYWSPQRENGLPAFVGTPGLIELCNPGAGEVRNMIVEGSVLYAVIGDTVYEIDSNWNSTAMTNAMASTDKYVWMSSNGSQILITDWYGNGYLLESGVLSSVSDLSNTTGSTYQDTYFIASTTYGFQISGNLDGSSWDGLDSTNAEGNPDIVKTVLSDHRELFVFGGVTTEIYQNTGNVDFPFERMEGGFIEKGIASPSGVCKQDNTVFGLTNDRQFFKLINYSTQYISTRWIEEEVGSYSRVDDMIAFAQVYSGHTFVWFIFPTANKTLVYDAATDLWHKRSEFNGGRHRANCYAYFNGVHVIGDDNGKIYKLDADTYDNEGDVLKRKILFPPVFDSQNHNKLAHSRLEIYQKTGVGLQTGQGNDPISMLRWSDDRMRTWSNERWSNIGKAGKTDSRSLFRRLGSSRERIYEWTMTDPVECEITDVYLRATPGIS